MLSYKQKKSHGGGGGKGGNRLLITVTVLGSAGPLRFVVGEEELVAAVIDTALKSYAREGRLPLLTSDLNHFYLYSPTAGPEALSPVATIGSCGTRNFMLCKKPQPLTIPAETTRKTPTTANWKSWLNMKITTH